MSDGVNIFVCGRTGSGKTHLVKRAIAEAPRLLVYLTKREDHGYPGIYFDGMLDDEDERTVVRMHSKRSMLLWWKWCEERRREFRLVYRPKDIFDFEEFDEICRLVYTCGDMVFVAEELMTYTSSYDMRRPDHGQGCKALLTAGRTRGITTWLLSQRPAKIPREITSQARAAYLFAMHEPADVQYIKEAFGIEAATRLEQLGPFEHVHWTDDGAIAVAKAQA
jgi:hypothetical protein